MYVVLKVYPLYIDLIMKFRAFLEIRMLFLFHRKYPHDIIRIDLIIILDSSVGRAHGC